MVDPDMRSIGMWFPPAQTMGAAVNPFSATRPARLTLPTATSLKPDRHNATLHFETRERSVTLVGSVKDEQDSGDQHPGRDAAAAACRQCPRNFPDFRHCRRP